MNKNTVKLRVWGDLACFTRPEMKVERVSYPLMTPSAARGVLEAVYWEPQMHYLVQQIGVVRRGCWINLRRNEVQTVVSVDSLKRWMAGKSAPSPIQAGAGAPEGTQRNTLALAGVEYIIIAEIRLTKRANRPEDIVGKYVEQVRRRSSAGKCFHRPYLGCREFAADFEWCDNPNALPLEPWNEALGLMLYDVFDHDGREGGESLPAQALFFQAAIAGGWMNCRPDQVQMVRGKIKEAPSCS